MLDAGDYGKSVFMYLHSFPYGPLLVVGCSSMS